MQKYSVNYVKELILMENIPFCEILIKEENFILTQYSCITNKRN